MALSLILPQKTLEEDKERISVGHNYCTPLTSIEPVEPEGSSSTMSTELLSPVKCHPASLEEIKERCIKLKQRLFVDEKDVDRIEKQTVGQSANENWNLHRKIRITASNAIELPLCKRLPPQQRPLERFYITSRYLKQGQ